MIIGVAFNFASIVVHSRQLLGMDTIEADAIRHRKRFVFLPTKIVGEVLRDLFLPNFLDGFHHHRVPRFETTIVPFYCLLRF